jgi:hypothetical protein
MCVEYWQDRGFSEVESLYKVRSQRKINIETEIIAHPNEDKDAIIERLLREIQQMKEIMNETVTMNSEDNLIELLRSAKLKTISAPSSENKQNIQKACSSVGEIVGLFVEKGDILNIKIVTATFSLLKFGDSDMIGLTVFHLQNEFLSDKFDRYFFIHFGDINFHRISSGIMEDLSELQKDGGNSYLVKSFLELTNHLNFYFINVQIDTKFLKLRKKFLKSNENSNILIDPKYGLQPMPSADFLIFKINPFD